MKLFFALLTHSCSLAGWPGLHFDEAWAALYAAEIATKPGFWPLAAMSPYTMPWAHYWAALFFKIFGISLTVYRASQLSLVVVGILFVVRTLWQKGKAKAAVIFVWLVVFCPLAILNHRFGIELTSWHVAMFGIFLWAVHSPKYYWLAIISALLGTTAHLLFFGFLTAWVLSILLSGYELKKNERQAIAAVLLLLLPFFAFITLSVPEKGKASALFLFSLAAALVLLFFYKELRAFLAIIGPLLKRLLFLLSVPFLANLFFYLDGHWVQWIMTGIQPNSWTVGMPLLVLLLGSAWAFFSAGGKRNQPLLPANFLLFLCLTALALGAMMLKPAPRYYELAMLLVLLGIAFLWSRLRVLPLMTMLIAWAVVSIASLSHIDSIWQNDSATATELRFGRFKDNSVDYLPKQKLAKFLALKGCTLSGIRGGDPRVLTALRFLAYGDWPLSQGNCPWPLYRVELKNVSVATADSQDFLEFRIFRAEK